MTREFQVQKMRVRGQHRQQSVKSEVMSGGSTWYLAKGSITYAARAVYGSPSHED
jgi:hypothetical protein